MKLPFIVPNSYHHRFDHVWIVLKLFRYLFAFVEHVLQLLVRTELLVQLAF